MKEQHQLFDKLRMNYKSRKPNCVGVERKAQLYKNAFWHGSMILPRNLDVAKNRLSSFLHKPTPMDHLITRNRGKEANKLSNMVITTSYSLYLLLVILCFYNLRVV